MIAALSLDSSYLFMRFDPLCSFLYQNVRLQIIFLSLNLDLFFSLWQDALLCNHFCWEFCLYRKDFFSCSSVQSLLRPKNHGWSQKGASLRDKWSFHHYSPTLSNQRVPVKLISILIRVEILRAQWHKYVTVYRKIGKTITAKPLNVWLCSK